MNIEYKLKTNYNLFTKKKQKKTKNLQNKNKLLHINKKNRNFNLLTKKKQKNFKIKTKL